MMQGVNLFAADPVVWFSSDGFCTVTPDAARNRQMRVRPEGSGQEVDPSLLPAESKLASSGGPRERILLYAQPARCKVIGRALPLLGWELLGTATGEMHKRAIVNP